MSVILSITAAFIISFILLPIVIKVSRSIDLLDIPDRRKIHSVSTPVLGGVGIFAGFIIAVTFAVPFHLLAELKYLLFGLLIIFFMGLRDDISSLSAKHKLLAQVFATFLVVYFSDIRLTGFYGMFGVHEIAGWLQIGLTMFVIVGLTNSFNLIDGIDGLAGSIGICILSFFGWVFLESGHLEYGVLALSVVGSLFAFLFFNWQPSKVFMGDTGSMILGFIVSSLAIQFINVSHGATLFNLEITSTVGLCVSVMIVPIFDTLRVFTIRFSKGRNPFDPDRNHIHHGLLTLGMNHASATITLVGFNVAIVVMAVWLNGTLTNGSLTVLTLTLALLANGVMDMMLYRKKHLRKSAQVKSKDDLYISKSA